jgi:hypothetical protein
VGFRPEMSRSKGIRDARVAAVQRMGLIDRLRRRRAGPALGTKIVAVGQAYAKITARRAAP